MPRWALTLLIASRVSFGDLTPELGFNSNFSPLHTGHRITESMRLEEIFQISRSNIKWTMAPRTISRLSLNTSRDGGSNI